MEDVARVEPLAGSNGEFAYVGIMDGHGGDASALWLQEGLFAAVSARLAEVAAALPAVREEELQRAAEAERERESQGSAARRRAQAGGAATSKPTTDRREHAAQAKTAVEAAPAPPPLADALTRAFLDADAKLIAHLRATVPTITGASGASATVVLVHRPTRTVVAASAGDSLAVLARGGQGPASLARLCRPHRVLGTGPDARAEAARVEAAGGWVQDGRVCGVLAVSRALGDPEFKGKEGLAALLDEGAKRGWWDGAWAAQRRSGFRADPVVAEPDVHAMALRAPAAHAAGEGEGPQAQEDGSSNGSGSSQQQQPPDDEFLVVASDGLWDAVPPPDVLRYARTQFKSGKNAQEVAEALAELALKRYTADNTCVAVIDLLGPERREASGGGGGGGGGGGKKGGGGLFGGLFGR
jgi:serine/threonine protein phosphatase PrpC